MQRSSILKMFIAVVLGLAVLVPNLTVAQEASDAPSGLTVTGFGEASAPADTATVEVVIGAPNFGPPQAPSPGATPGAQEREAVAPAVDALVDAGIPEDAIEVIVGPFLNNVPTYGGPAQALLRFDVSDPSAERISELINAATVGAADERLTINGVGVRYEVADCAALERQAREAAIADARTEAETLASLLGVTPGALLAVDDVSYDPTAVALLGGLLPMSGCSPVDGEGFPPGAFVSSALTFDPTQEAVVTVYAQVEMTFAVSGESDATPSA